MRAESSRGLAGGGDRIGTKKHPAVVRVATEERARQILDLCNQHGIQVIVGIDDVGSRAIVLVAVLGTELRARVTTVAVRELAIERGRTVWIAIKASAFRRVG